jgi:hypothetical protein
VSSDKRRKLNENTDQFLWLDLDRARCYVDFCGRVRLRCSPILLATGIGELFQDPVQTGLGECGG